MLELQSLHKVVSGPVLHVRVLVRSLAQLHAASMSLISLNPCTLAFQSSLCSPSEHPAKRNSPACDPEFEIQARGLIQA